MQKTFKMYDGALKYKVLINRNKKVTIQTGTEEIIFFFGNPKYVQFESEYLTNFLEARIHIISAYHIKSYILNKISDAI